jgi:four helix bundle protein
MVYDAINSGPAFQRGRRLKDQCTGAAISVMGNIPEGFVRRSNREFIQFLFISASSAAELQSHMYVALDQPYATKDIFDGIYQQADKTSKMTSGLITYLRSNEAHFKQKKQEELKKLWKRYKPGKPDEQNRLDKPGKRDKLGKPEKEAAVYQRIRVPVGRISDTRVSGKK